MNLFEDKEARSVALRMRVGSFMRNLHSQDSDADYKEFVFPSFNDLYTGKMFKDYKTSKDIDVEVHDIRKLEDLLVKGNITYVELLYSPDLCTYSVPEMDDIVWCREDISRINLPNFFRANMGVYKSQREAMTKVTSEDTDSVICEVGYNPKAFYLAIHFLKVLLRYKRNGFNDFGSVIWYTGKDREEMLSYKKGDLTPMEAYKLLDELYTLCKNECEDKYLSYPVDNKTINWLNSTIKLAVLNSIK